MLLCIKTNSMHQEKKSFTLLEMLIVVVIVGILIAIAIPAYFNAKKKAIKAEAIATLTELRKICLAYEDAYDKLPIGQIQSGKAIRIDADYDDIYEMEMVVVNNERLAYQIFTTTNGKRWLVAWSAKAEGFGWAMDLDTGGIGHWDFKGQGF